MSEGIAHPSITVIESNNRFKVAATFSPLLVNYFKTIEGRFYDFSLKQWSFPNDAWENLQAFFEERNFGYIKVKAEKYLTITKTNGSLLLKFAAFQPDFKFLNEIKGATYDRNISMYVIPDNAEKQLEKILKDHKYTYHTNEKGQSIFNKLSNEDQGGPIKKRKNSPNGDSDEDTFATLPRAS